MNFALAITASALEMVVAPTGFISVAFPSRSSRRYSATPLRPFAGPKEILRPSSNCGLRPCALASAGRCLLASGFCWAIHEALRYRNNC